MHVHGMLILPKYVCLYMCVCHMEYVCTLHIVLFVLHVFLVSKMSPNRVFDHAFEVVRNNPEVKSRLGDTIKAYGRDHGGHREGRRNFVEHTQYKDEYGDERTRIRFNLEGRFGKAFCFAEVSKSMPAGEFVYGKFGGCCCCS